jgi:hypothetical protein
MQGQISGTLSLNSNFSALSDTSLLFQGYNHIMGKLDLSFSLLGLPVKAGGFATTADPFTAQSSVQYYLGLDAQRINTDLKGRLSERLMTLSRDSLRLPRSKWSSDDLKAQKLAYADPKHKERLLKKLNPDAQARSVGKIDSLEILSGQKAQLSSRIDSVGRVVKSNETINTYRALQDSIRRLEEKEDRLVNELAKLTHRIDSLPPGLPNTPDADKDALLRKYLQNPGSVSAKELHKNGLITKQEQLLSYLKKVQIGTVFPNHSEFTLAGAPLTGLHVVVEPENYHFAASLLKNAQQPIIQPLQGFFRPRFQNSFSHIQYARNLYALSLGTIIKEGFDLKIHSLSATDIPNNADNTLTPKSNRVLSAAFCFRPKSIPITLDFEAASAATVLDNQVLKVREADWMINQRLTPDSLFNRDFALKADAKYRLNASTSIRGGYRKVGPQYFSAGNLFLRTGMERYSIGAEKFLLKGQIRTVTDLWYENLIMGTENGKGGTTSIQTAFKRMPVFTLSANFFDSQIQNALTKGAYSLTSYGINAVVSHSFQVLGKANQAALNAGYQAGVSELDTANNVLGYASFQNSIRFNRKLNLQIQANYQDTQYFDRQFSLFTAELGCTYKFSKKTNLSPKAFYVYQSDSFNLFGCSTQIQTVIAQRITFRAETYLYYTTNEAWLPRVQLEMRYAF